MQQMLFYSKGVGGRAIEKVADNKSAYRTCIQCTLTRKDAAAIIATLANQFEMFERSDKTEQNDFNFGLLLFGDLEDLA